uniref:Uncharacterized protein n=1 Tax=Heliothis virescens TaxID=7102 RepID=A0A2A4K230_HELVI
MLRLCIICVSFGLIRAAPFAYQDPFIPNYDTVDYDGMDRPARNLIMNGDPEMLLRPLEVNSKSSEQRVYSESDEIIRLPPAPSEISDFDELELDSLPRSTYFEHGIQAALPLEYVLNAQNVPSTMLWNNQYLPIVDSSNYEVNGLNTDLTDNVDAEPYEVDLYPLVHSSMSAALNSVPTLNSYPPPVYASQMDDNMSTLETRADYDIDVLNPENSELMPPNLRITRSRRDYLEDLAHDAMLNNLLPTMSVPFVRGAGRASVPQAARQMGPVTATYPGVSNNCAVPILLRCSPNIVRGTLSGTYAEQSPPVMSGAVYREKNSNSHKTFTKAKM